MMTNCSWLVENKVRITLAVAVIAVFASGPAAQAAERVVLAEYFSQTG